MEAQFLWVVKTPKSTCLSRSSRAEEARIRHHVQRRQATVLPDQVEESTVSMLITPTPWELQLNRDETRGLEFFIQRSVPECAGWQDEDFWSRLVFQACSQDSAIVHGLVAIAARHEISCNSPSDDRVAGLERVLASQRSKAFRLAGTAAGLTHATSLISCIILASLQSHQRDYQTFRLIRSGLAIVQEVNQLNGPRHMHIPRSFINDSVRPLIERLGESVCAITDQPAALASSVMQTEMKDRPNQHLLVVPSKFQTLRHARDSLEAILNWGHDHVLASHRSTMALEFYHSLLSERIRRWGCSLDNSDLPRPSLLHIAALNGLILLSTFNAREETAFDIHIPTFQRIMELASQFAPPDHARRSLTFDIDNGLIGIVAFTATRCRDPCVRRSALDWLQHSSRYEGERLSCDSASIARAWIELEEAGRDVHTAADIPETARRRLIAGERYHAARRLKLTFATSPFDETALTKADVIWLDDVDATAADGCASADGLPDVVFAASRVSFLDSRETEGYYHIRTKNFYFPIPRV